MVERGVDGLPGGFDVGEVEHPAERRIDVAAEGEFDLERMAVQARTRMGCWQRGQAPGALQVKDAEDVHAAFSRKFRALTMRMNIGADVLPINGRPSANAPARKTQAAQQPSDCAPDLPLAWIGGHGTVPYEQ